MPPRPGPLEAVKIAQPRLIWSTPQQRDRAAGRRAGRHAPWWPCRSRALPAWAPRILGRGEPWTVVSGKPSKGIPTGHHGPQTHRVTAACGLFP